MKRITPVRIDIRDSRTPYSPRFDDVYFAAEQGIEESNYVYLEGSGFLERIRSPGNTITLGEIGFGVGLNFLLTLKAFRNQAHVDQRLVYFSAEQFPVVEEDLRTLYSLYPELAKEAEELLAQYPVLVPGFHSLSFLEGRVQLILMFGEASASFSRFEAKTDFWYWDGFAPSKNPDAFSEKLFQEVARLSAKGAQGASFTSAGWVRRGLEAVGFQIEKRTGFGKKRECIRGRYTKDEAGSLLPAWYSNQNLKTMKPGQTVAVIGAGLAGSAIACALQARGARVQVFDAHGIATRASGNSLGLFNVQLSRLPNPISRISQLSLVHSISEIKSRGIARRDGILRTAGETEKNEALESLITSEYPENFYSVTERGIAFPGCGIINPGRLSSHRLTGIPFQKQMIEGAVAQAEGFRIIGVESSILAEVNHVVYALGADHALPGFQHPVLQSFPVKKVRGQLLHLRANENSSSLETTLVESGYVTPVDPGITGHSFHVLGATYQTRPASDDQIELDNHSLLEDARNKWPEFSTHTSQDITKSVVGYRLSTPDKLPLIGPIFSAEKLCGDFERNLKGMRGETSARLQVNPGEWCFTGFGSRGITYSSLGAEILANLMFGLPLPIELDLWLHLHSARFHVRNLKKTTK